MGSELDTFRPHPGGEIGEELGVNWEEIEGKLGVTWGYIRDKLGVNWEEIEGKLG